MSANPDAIVKVWTEFKRLSPDRNDLVLGGIFAGKGGYHNTRANHLANRNGGSRSDYSVQLTTDKRGPSDKAAALDITFNTARKSDFRIIAKYSQRLLKAFKAKDSRLFYKGKAVVREFFGNTDLDRTVEGWSLYRGRAVSSDSSHLWHIHISFHREYVENYEAIKGVLDVLLDRKSAPVPKPTPPPNGKDNDEMPTPKELWDVKYLEYIDENGNTKRDDRSAADILFATHLHAVLADRKVDVVDNKIDALTAKVNELLARGN